MPIQCSRGTAIGLFSTIVSLVVASPVFAQASPPVANVSISVTDSVTQTAEIVGTPGSGGSQLYVAAFAAPDGLWSVSLNLTVDWTSNPSTSIVGSIVAKNFANKPLEFLVDFDVNICPAVEDGSFTGGNGKITLISDGPGSITCGSEAAAFGVRVNGKDDGALFWCPFNLATTGSGTMSSNATFGLPGPSDPGPRNVSSIGSSIAIELTPADTATAWSALLFKDANGVTPNLCPGDLDGNGVVDGADLGELFSQWGAQASCPSDLVADLTGDGEVNGDDLVALITSWGVCDDDLTDSIRRD